ncbi:hypothetical protein [Corynebacterium epidermidicanis]|nr:hypothetical protein [Corynebacterium epidermidicanis]
MVRALADTQQWEWQNWFAPLGWLNVVDPFGEGSIGNLTVIAIAVVGSSGALVGVDKQRQCGAGMPPARVGKPARAHRLPTPLHTRLYLDRGSRFTWNIVAACLGLFLALLSGSMQELMTQDETTGKLFRDMFPAEELETAFLTYTSEFVGLLLAIATVGTALNYRHEEKTHLVEVQRAAGIKRSTPMVLATISTIWTALSCTLAAVAGTTAGAAIASQHPATARKVAVIASASQLFPMLAIGGIAILIQGSAPKLSALSWVPLLYCGTISLFGPLLKLPEWLSKTSAFGHTINYTSVTASAFVPQAIMVAIAVVAATLASSRVPARRFARHPTAGRGYWKHD